MPEFYLIGGPNGVGKSTFSDDTFSSFTIINGDRIAKEMKEAGLTVDDYSRKRAIDDQIKSALTKHQSLVFESNLNVPSNYKLTDTFNISLMKCPVGLSLLLINYRI